MFESVHLGNGAIIPDHVLELTHISGKALNQRKGQYRITIDGPRLSGRWIFSSGDLEKTHKRRSILLTVDQTPAIGPLRKNLISFTMLVVNVTHRPMTNSSNKTLIASISDPISGFRVMFEDDGRVAYAYLLAPDGKFVADVWLYNRGKPPLEPEWHDRSLMPFANPADYVEEDGRFMIPTKPSDISVDWDASDPSGLTARIHVHGELFAMLRPGSKPGWSLLAVRNGPLALKLGLAN